MHAYQTDTGVKCTKLSIPNMAIRLINVFQGYTLQTFLRYVTISYEDKQRMTLQLEPDFPTLAASKCNVAYEELILSVTSITLATVLRMTGHPFFFI